MVVSIEKNTRWAVNTFETWVDLRNHRLNDTFAPNVLLKVPPTDSKGQTESCRALSLFVIEASGELYPVRTIPNVVSHTAMYG